MNNVKAFVFDVFGTVVDWRTSVVAELQAQGAKHGIKPGAFIDSIFPIKNFIPVEILSDIHFPTGGKHMYQLNGSNHRCKQRMPIGTSLQRIGGVST